MASKAWWITTSFKEYDFINVIIYKIWKFDIHNKKLSVTFVLENNYCKNFK